jgi:hypothetical protein
MAWRGASNQFIEVPASGDSTTRVAGLPVARFPIRNINLAPPPGVPYGVPGTPVAGASGNPAVSTNPVAAPPHTPYGQPRVLGVAQETAWRGGWQFVNDKLTVSDRHIMSKTGSERSGRDSGNTDPPSQGPARPSYQTINRTINYQKGTDNTRNQDDPTRPYTRNAQGMYIGEQGTGWAPVSGGVPGLWQPYGSYGGYTAGPVKGIQSPVPYGAPGDGRQSVFSGPPHGLHTETLPDYSLTLGYYMAVPQMRQPRVDRPSNSRIAGQSYSQTVIPQGQTGTIAQQAGGARWRTGNTSAWRGRT